MTWILVTRKHWHKMEGEFSIEKIAPVPNKKAVNAGDLEKDNIHVDFEREEPPTKDTANGAAPLPLKRSAACDALNKKWEGYHKPLGDGHCTAYKDADGGPDTIGWGTTYYPEGSGAARRYGARKVRMGDILSRAEADELHDMVLDGKEILVASRIKAPVTQAMFDALVCFHYNVNPDKWPEQIERINERKYKECYEFFDNYIKGTQGNNLPGLLNRRREEQDLFASQGFLTEGHATPAKLEPTPGYAALTRTRTKWHNGCELLELHIGDQTLHCVSGLPSRQFFRKPADPSSYPGCKEPLPQGEYTIGSIMFAGGKDNYNVSHGRGIGPVWVPLEAKFKDDRGAFGFHNDENAPGTEGCVGLVNLAELKKFVAALREFDPHTLVVDWGL